jgi:NAD/NADP transhydrogenase beta subunit
MMRTALLDRCSIGLSFLCLAHCLAIPLLVSAAPVLATFAFADESFHLALVVLVVPTSLIALCLGCRLHRSLRIPLLGLTGVSVLAAAAFASTFGLDEIAETVLTVTGALVVASAHLLNYRACRACECEHH